MLILKNNSGSFSKVGAVVMQDPRSKDAFVYATKGSTKVLGVVIESVPYRALCKIATQGDTARVFVVGNVVKGNTLRLGKSSDNISLGLTMVAKTGDSPYLRIGDALSSGRGLISCILELSYQGNEDGGYVPYAGATQDLNMGAYNIYASAIHVDDILQENGEGLLTEAGHYLIS